MAYTKHNWKERLGTKLNRFKDLITGEHLELVNDPEGVTQEGTPLRAEWLNEMEQGIDDAHTIGEAAQASANAAQTTANAALPRSSYTASDVLNKIKSVDGSGSGLDADTLDGYQGDYYTRRGKSYNRIGIYPIIEGNSDIGQSYIQFYNNASTRQAYIGLPSAGNTELTFENEVAGGRIRFRDKANGAQYNNRTIATVSYGTSGPPSTLAWGEIYIQY